ncbi:hypothetical protein WICPIJ_000081 [Wickerhamomyces pijperi]|uniref:Uncharacterized protein n=1 Tax=Wickerhamomyces pijperi TaxID=599730 RepID=A0A9P8TR55_WICPI|nr:hypothetical protein WICPIJ_000081 [Wickerhamomyces pijperi]
MAKSHTQKQTQNEVFRSFPTDLKCQIFDIQTDPEKLQLLSIVPELFVFDRKSHEVVVVIKPSNKPLPKPFLCKYGNITTPFIIDISAKFTDPKPLTKFTRKAIKGVCDQLNGIIPKIKAKLDHNRKMGLGAPTAFIDFAFDMDNNNVYTTANLYPYLFQILKDIPHHLNIYKTETDMSKLTKTRHGEFSLFDAIMDIQPIETSKESPLATKGTSILDFKAPVMMMLPSKTVRMTTLFTECKSTSFRNSIIDIKSNLKGITVVTPSPKSDSYESALKRKDDEEATLIPNLKDALYKSFFNDNQLMRLLRYWWYYIRLAQDAAAVRDMSIFYSLITTNLAMIFPYCEEFRDAQHLTGRERYFGLNEAFYSMFSDIHLADKSDTRQYKTDWSTRFDYSDNFTKKRIENEQFRDHLDYILSKQRYPELNDQVKEIPHDRSLREYNIFGEHWLESYSHNPPLPGQELTEEEKNEIANKEQRDIKHSFQIYSKLYHTRREAQVRFNSAFIFEKMIYD